MRAGNDSSDERAIALLNAELRSGCAVGVLGLCFGTKVAR